MQGWEKFVREDILLVSSKRQLEVLLFCYLFIFLNSETFYNILQRSSYGLASISCRVLALHLTAEEFV